MSALVDEARERSVRLLAEAATRHGFVASPSFDHYAVVWARDALIASLGALAADDSELTEGVAVTLDTLAAHASSLGQIPALVDPGRRRWDFGEGGVVDATAWFVVVASEYVLATGDVDRAREWWPAVRSAERWLSFQDVTGSSLISAAPSTDWMDAALTRSGRTLHLNVLWFWAATAFEHLAARLGEDGGRRSADIGRAVDAWFWPEPGTDVDSLFAHGFAHDATRIAMWEAASASRTHYVSHIVHAAFVDRCDVLANLLAIRCGLASTSKARAILGHLEAAADPFPTRTFPDPIDPGDGTGMLISAAEAVIPERWRNRPGRYHNAAAWPYIGGFHVQVVATVLGREQGRGMLARLAAANALDDWSFPEWIDGEGRPAGARLQTWNAATFLLAYAACFGT